MSLLSLDRKVAKLESGGNAPRSPLGSGWWDDFSGDYALLADPSWRPYCDLDRFVVGRASMLANLWAGRLVCGLHNWRLHQEPYWWTSPVWRNKTANWEQQIESERRLYCPPENRQSMASFVNWLYGDRPKREGDRPWEWCQPDVGNQYTWPDYGFHRRGLLPLVHALAIASATWLIDDLGLQPEQVQASASLHLAAFRWRELSRLREVELPPHPIISNSPTLPIARLTTWARAHNLPVDAERVKAGDRLELLELLLCVASGCGGPHGRERWFPALSVPVP